MTMKSIWVAGACLLGIAACSTTDTATETKSSNSAYSDKEILSFMFGGGTRDPEKLAARIAEADKHPLGARENPVRVNMPAGERAYLARLRCSDGAAPSFSRDGSFGAGPYETILDRYTVICANGTPAKSSVYMDMYFPEHKENRPIAGFTIE